MEKEGKNQIQRAKETTDFVLQWGNRKRNRCCKLKKDSKNLDESNHNNSSDGNNHNHNNNKNKLTTDSLSKKKSASRIVSLDKGSPHRLSKNSDLPVNNRKPPVASPEKEDRYYTTRGSLGLDENGKLLMDHLKEDKKTPVWPKLFIALSNKEKEEDFMAMKGCKPSQRPKKRAKLIQRSILLVSPGAWLSDLCQERYEVREKKTSKKRPRGLKAMGSMESDSE